MSERDRYFPFQVSVGGEETRTFTLSHKGEFVLNDIPIGSELMVSMEAPDYNIRASFNEDEETEDTLTVSSVPADGGTIVFRAEREAQLETGIRTRNSLCTTILIVIFLGLAMQPIIKYRLKPKYST